MPELKKISDHQQLYTEIGNTPFTCIRCGACCKEIEPGSNLVWVSPAEVRRIMTSTSLAFDEIAEPYPDTIHEGDRQYTLGWAIRREGDRCRFLVEGRCSIYESRPWICRTYPFMINNGKLAISPCNGISTGDSDSIEPQAINQLIDDLQKRVYAEQAEEDRIAKVLATVDIPSGKVVVVDGEGMRII